jgi:hypothetical protein
MKTYKVKVTDKVTKWYNRSNELHRENGPAEEYANGSKFYYINGKLHREDGPAVESAYGDKEYYINNKLHREDGPAVEHANGTKYYYINGKQLAEEEFNGNTVEKAADHYAHNYFDMHETNSYKELKRGFIAGVKWAKKL